MRARSILAFAACILAPALSAQTEDASSPNYFSTHLYPLLQQANCRVCHVEGGLAGSTRLHFPSSTATTEQVEGFGRGLAALVDRDNPERSLLLTKPTNREKHTGGQLIQTGGKEEAALRAWVRHLAATRSASPAPPPRLEQSQRRFSLRRLTHSQYNNTVRDLLGDETRPADRFPLEDFVNGFKNQIAAQDIPPLLAESYNAAAERLARAAFQGGTDERRLIPCRPRSSADAQCRSAFIRSFGLRAFRRPLSAAEQGRYEQLFNQGAALSGEFLGGAQLVVEAMLQSPKFLFRIERGSSPVDRAYEAASRLSYFLWDTMPDEALYESAEAGELATPAGLDKAVRRMLADAKARQALDEFTSQWLRFDLVLSAVKDRSSHPQFTPELAAAMAEETRMLVSEIVWNDRSFMEVFTAGHSFLNSDLAGIYGLPAPPAEFAKVQFPAESTRAGIIGQAAFLAMTSKPVETSPTVRGFFVRERFLCQQVPDPPPGTSANLPPISEERPQTNRERLKEHTTNASCSGCHNLMDPIGFGLEGFDAIGRSREKQVIVFMPDRRARGARPVKVELPLDARGSVQGIPNSAFGSPKELGLILARSAECQECVVKQVFRYAFGRREAENDRTLIDRAVAVFRESGYRLTALMAYLGKALASPEGET